VPFLASALIACLKDVVHFYRF